MIGRDKRSPAAFVFGVSVQPISDEQIEIIKATYAETGNIRASSRAANVSVSTAKKYCDSSDDLEQIRTEKRIDIIAKIAEVQVVLLDTMMSKNHLGKASLTEIGVTFGIISDKRQLLTGQATQRTETIASDPAARLTPDEIESAKRIRAKLAAEATR